MLNYMKNIKRKLNSKTNNNRGSVTLFIILLVTIIIVITGSLIATAAFQFKMSAVNTGFNKAFYINDGVVEEALAKISNFTRDVEIKVNNEMMSDDPEFEKEDKWIDFKNQMNLLLYDNGIKVENANAILAQAYNWEFRKQYLKEVIDIPSDYLTDYTLEIQWVEGLDDAEDYYELKGIENFKIDAIPINALASPLRAEINDSKFNPGRIAGQDYDTVEGTSGDSFVLTQSSSYNASGELIVVLNSDGHYDNQGKYIEIGKQMEATVSVILPQYTFITASEKSTGSLYKNPILGNSLIAQEDIIVTGGTVTVKGDGNAKVSGEKPGNGGVYALGSIADVPANTNAPRETIGGVVIGYDKDDITFATDIVKQGNFKLSDKIIGPGDLRLTSDASLATLGNITVLGDGSNLEVSHNVYASGLGVLRMDDTFVVDDFVSTIGNNVYIYEDVYIGGKNTKIKLGSVSESGMVGGKLNCLLSVSPGGQQTKRTGSLYITGERTYATDAELFAKPVIEMNSLLLRGLARLDVYKTISDVKHYYRSGESFFTGHNINYYGYEWAGTVDIDNIDLLAEDIYTIPGDDPDTTKDYSLVAATDSDEDPKFKASFFLEVMRTARDKPGEIDVAFASLEDRTSLKIHSMVLKEEGGIEKASEKANISLGVFQGTGRYTPEGSTIEKEVGTVYWNQHTDDDIINNIFGSGYVDPEETIPQLKIDQYTHQLGYIQYDADVLYNTGKNILKKDKHIHEGATTDPYMIEWMPGYVNNLIPTVNGGNIIEYYNGTEEDLYINSEGLVLSGSPKKIDASKLEGVIVNKGNIYVCGVNNILDFKGTLVSGKSIIFLGSKAKNITYDEKTVYHTMYRQGNRGQTLKIIDVFGVDKGRALTYSEDIRSNFSSGSNKYSFQVTENFTDENRINITTGSLTDDVGAVKENKETYKIINWREK